MHMTPTIGIDLVEINRFKQWHVYSDCQLSKLFSKQEIIFCRAIPLKSAERFAARFAAKEAFFKALAPYAKETPPLLAVFKSIEIVTSRSGAQFRILWEQLIHHYQLPAVHLLVQLSISHTGTTAGAVVVTYNFS